MTQAYAREYVPCSSIQSFGVQPLQQISLSTAKSRSKVCSVKLTEIADFEQKVQVADSSHTGEILVILLKDISELAKIDE